MEDRVIFRKWADGDIIAILPDNPHNAGYVDMYEHIGQHGEGKAKIIGNSKLAKPEEYAYLLEELTQIGYDLRVMKRLTV